MVEKVTTTWLQCTLPKSDWDAINGRRLKLNLKWSDIIIPGTLNYLAELEAKAGKGKRSKKEAQTKAGEQ